MGRFNVREPCTSAYQTSSPSLSLSLPSSLPLPFPSYSCPVCRYTQIPEPGGDSTCFTCDAREVCLCHNVHVHCRHDYCDLLRPFAGLVDMLNMWSCWVWSLSRWTRPWVSASWYICDHICINHPYAANYQNWDFCTVAFPDLCWSSWCNLFLDINSGSRVMSSWR